MVIYEENAIYMNQYDFNGTYPTDCPWNKN